MQKIWLTVIGFAGILALPGYATRILKVAPISLVTVHGGWLKDSGGLDRICITAGMLQTPPLQSGPVCAYHQLNFHLKNLSHVQKQSISVKLLPGTYLISSNSDGAKSSIPGTKNVNSFTLDKELQAGSFTLPPDGSKEYRITFACDSTGCKLFDNQKGDLETRGTKFDCDTSDPAPQQVCIDLRSLAIPVFTVDEDHGAVVGTMTTVAHRVQGWTDFHLTSPASYQLNGGRPF